MESTEVIQNNVYFTVNGIFHIIKDTIFEGQVYGRSVYIRIFGSQYESVCQSPNCTDPIEIYIMDNIIHNQNTSLFAHVKIYEAFSNKDIKVKIFKDDKFDNCIGEKVYLRHGLEELREKERQDYLLSLDKVDKTTYRGFSDRISKDKNFEQKQKLDSAVRKLVHDSVDEECKVNEVIEGRLGQELLSGINDDLLDDIEQSDRELIENTIFNSKCFAKTDNNDAINDELIIKDNNDAINDELIIKHVHQNITMLANSYLCYIMWGPQKKVSFESEVEVRNFDNCEEETEHLPLNSSKTDPQKRQDPKIDECEEEAKKLDGEFISYQKISYETKPTGPMVGSDMRAKEQRREALKSEMNNSSKSVSLLNEF